MRLNPLARLASLAGALVFSACNVGTDGASGSSKVSFAIPFHFAAPAAPAVAAQTVENGTDIDRIEATITIKSTGAVVLRKTLTEGSPEVQGGDNSDPVVTLSFRVPDGAEAETFTIQMDASFGGVKLFTIGPIDFQLANGRASLQATANYVGPGGNVTGVEISPRGITVAQGQTANFSCTGTPGNVTAFPYALETVNSQVANVVNTTTVRGNTVGTTDLICRLGIGSHAEDRVTVTVTGGGIGGISGTVVSATGAPLPNVTVEVRRGSGNTSGTPVATTTTGTGGAYSFTGLEAGAYTVRASAQFFVAASANVTVTANQTATANLTLVSNGTVPGGLTGTVTHSTTGFEIGGAVVEVRAGNDNTTGAVAGSSTTNGSGVFLIENLAPGPYTLKASATGYTTFTQNVTVTAGQITTVGISLVNPSATRSVEIVLNWGAAPPDLDAHLYAPNGNHIFWRVPGDCLFACLDHDDVNGSGPETISISTQEAGTYFFHVHNWSLNCTQVGPEISASGATVRVYFNGVLQRTFTPPAGSGTNWAVFQLNGTTITPVNTLQAGAPGGETCSSAGPGATRAK